MFTRLCPTPLYSFIRIHSKLFELSWHACMYANTEMVPLGTLEVIKNTLLLSSVFSITETITVICVRVCYLYHKKHNCGNELIIHIQHLDSKSILSPFSVYMDLTWPSNRPGGSIIKSKLWFVQLMFLHIQKCTFLMVTFLTYQLSIPGTSILVSFKH